MSTITSRSLLWQKSRPRGRHAPRFQSHSLQMQTAYGPKTPEPAGDRCRTVQRPQTWSNLYFGAPQINNLQN